MWPQRVLYASFQVAGCADPPPRQQRSRSEESSPVALHRTCRRTARQSAVLCCVGEVPATPVSAILSTIIDLLQRRSFSKSIYESSAGRSAHTPRDAINTAHLFDARRTLPRHSCQGPQGWGLGRTSGMKGSFVSAAAAITGQQNGRTPSRGGVFRSVTLAHLLPPPGVDYFSTFAPRPGPL